MQTYAATVAVSSTASRVGIAAYQLEHLTLDRPDETHDASPRHRRAEPAIDADDPRLKVRAAPGDHERGEQRDDTSAQSRTHETPGTMCDVSGSPTSARTDPDTNDPRRADHVRNAFERDRGRRFACIDEVAEQHDFQRFARQCRGASDS